MSLIKSIPNTITCLNLLSGCFAVVNATYGNFKAAFLCIIAAAVFDFLDGFCARLLKAYSPMGKELDSLADMVSFGVAPAMIMYTFSKITVEGYVGMAFSTSLTSVIGRNFLIYAPLAIAVFSGLRLAKFNIDERQTENFIGLATPSCAMICGSLLYASDVYPYITVFLQDNSWFVPALSLILSYLLVCEIPMFSFKFKNFSVKDNAVRFAFVGLSAVIAIISAVFGFNWSVWVFATFVVYILLNLVLAVVPSKN